MRTVLTGLLVAGLVIAGGQGALAQEHPSEHAKYRDRVEWMTMWKLMEALDLDKSTADKVYEIRREFIGQKKELIKEIGAEIDSLRQALLDRSSNVTDDELNQKIQSIRGKRKKLEAILDEQFTELSKVLTVRQQAKLVVFMKDFREELRALFGRPRPGDPQPLERGFGHLPPPDIPPLHRAPGTGKPPRGSMPD
jgi:hypothetical protein